MSIRIPERNKKTGVCYALTDDGIELPVIDTTHPSFALTPDEPEIARRIEEYLKMMQKWNQMPRLLQWLFSTLYLRRSVLARGAAEKTETFLTGMNTYLMKLGPQNLGQGYASGVDRKLAEALPAFGIRLRLRNTARLIAEGLQAILARRKERHIRLLNIAGGPSMDSLNALILTRRERPELLRDRHFRILVLDIAPQGASFGNRAAEALCAPGGPLNGVDVTVEWHRYDWSVPETLSGIAATDADDNLIAVGSSEGGLFEYGSDEEIGNNLRVIGKIVPEDFHMVATVLDDNLVTRSIQQSTHLAIRCLKRDHFEQMAEQAGWQIQRRLEGPTAHCLSLSRAI
ncbi:MAG TPA: hypothetical protein PLA90_00555 [Candidatus Sumerlaeota bacterium]|nr:hypothetical protein [Candidatus Sumerlaeota bacterium]